MWWTCWFNFLNVDNLVLLVSNRWTVCSSNLLWRSQILQQFLSIVWMFCILMYRGIQPCWTQLFYINVFLVFSSISSISWETIFRTIISFNSDWDGEYRPLNSTYFKQHGTVHRPACPHTWKKWNWRTKNTKNCWYWSCFAWTFWNTLYKLGVGIWDGFLH